MTDGFFSIDDSFVPPEPFDRAIANLNVRCRSNSLEDGVNLDVDASFGTDEVRIELSDGSVLEAVCEISEAIVVLKTFNCDLAEGEGKPDGVGFSYNQRFLGQRETSQISQSKAVGGLSVSAPNELAEASTSISAAKEASKSSTDAYEVTGERSFEQVQLGIDQIRFHPNPDCSPLVGTLLDAKDCFKVLPPRNDKAFGILAELQVSKGWMKLKNPRPISATDKFKSAWDKAFNGTDPIDEFHRRAFHLLLEQLVSLGLQANADSKYATLAARAMRVEKFSSEEIEKRQIGLAERQLTLPVSTVESVLFEPRERVEDILIEAGITDLSELGALSSSMIFLPNESDQSARLVDLTAFLSRSYSVSIVRNNTEGEQSDAPRVFVPSNFARSFLLTPESSRREGCNEIEFTVVRDGLFITFKKDGSALTEVTKRGVFR